MIKFTYGCVASGKSLLLIRDYLNDLRKRPGRKITLIKPAKDTRTRGVYTRFGEVEISPTFILEEENRLNWLYELKSKDIFYFDEAQFLPEQVILDVVTNRRVDQEFYFYGLRNDINKVMWPSVIQLMNQADVLEEAPTSCDVCEKRKASFNKSTAIDGAGGLGFHYSAVCFECFYV